MRLVGEARVDGVDAPATLDVNLVVPVDHDLGHVGIAQVGLERPVAQDVVEHLVRDARLVGGGHRGLVPPQHALQRLDDALLQLSLVDVRVVQPGAEGLQKRRVHAALHGREGIEVTRRPPARGRLLQLARRG